MTEREDSYMSKEWTPEEIAAASAAMKKSGQMSYEELLAEMERQDAEREKEENETPD